MITMFWTITISDQEYDRYMQTYKIREKYPEYARIDSQLKSWRNGC